MSYVDFAVAVSLFLFFFAVALMFSTNYFSNLSTLTKTSEFISVSENLFTVFFEEKGVPEDWDENLTYAPVKIGLAEDLHKVEILLEETSGYNRTNELVSRHLVFDEGCVNKTWNDTIRVFDEDYNEVVYQISDNISCSSQYLKNANITWEVNVSANQTKKFLIYYSPDDGVDPPTFTSDLNTVGVWHLDEGSGTTAYDETGNDNDGTLHNGTVTCSNGDCPTWESGSNCKSGNCLSFDGSNDYVNVSDLPSMSATTLEAWVYVKGDSSGSNNAIIDNNIAGLNQGDIWFYIQNDGDIQFDIQNASGEGNLLTTDQPISDNAWYHIVGTYDGTNMIIYVNGSAHSTTASISDATPFSRDTNVSIGSNEGGSDNFFNGTIDEVRIYNRALTGEEINSSFKGSLLTEKIFPEENITTISYSKFNVLGNISYDDARKTIGEEYRFRLEIDEDSYGGNINQSVNVGCQEYPKIIQYINGTISKVKAKVCVWK